MFILISSSIINFRGVIPKDAMAFVDELSNWIFVGLKIDLSAQGLTRLLQLTGGWQYDEIIRLSLRFIKPNNVDFLNKIRYISIK